MKIISAWMVASLSRRKRIPPLQTLLKRKRKKPPPQTWEQQLAVAKLINARLNTKRK